MEQLLAGRTEGFRLLAYGLGLLLYFLPAVLAFWRAQKRFWIVLALNLVVGVAQGFVLQRFAPGMSVGLALLLANFGPLWLVLLAWSLMPGPTEAKLAAARETKWFDTIAALPLVIWFGAGALNLRPILVNDLTLILHGQGTPLVWIQFFALGASGGFNLLLVWVLLVRDKPVRRGKGVWGRIFAVVGTFMGVGILQLPTVELSPAMQVLAAILVGVGSIASLLVLWRLGVSFSIMPEARVLVTRGPYAWARHPLYGAEMITIIGTAIQFRQPWALLIALGVATLLIVRSLFEERVLGETYTEYAAYKAKTARFIPRII